MKNETVSLKNKLCNFEDDIQQLGVELSLLASLITFLDEGIENGVNIKETDISNIIIILKKIIIEIIDKYDNFEKVLYL